MGIGFDRTFVPFCYQRWLTAGQSSALPDALRALYEQEDSSNSQHQVQRHPWEELVPVGTHATADDIIKHMDKAYPELERLLCEAREVKLVTGSIPDAVELDLAFVVDCTGSMKPWITKAREQIRVITEAIVPRVTEKFPELHLSLRYGLVAYRDFDDAGHIVTHDFTTSAEELAAWVGVCLLPEYSPQAL